MPDSPYPLLEALVVGQADVNYAALRMEIGLNMRVSVLDGLYVGRNIGEFWLRHVDTFREALVEQGASAPVVEFFDACVVRSAIDGYFAPDASQQKIARKNLQRKSMRQR